MTKVKTEAKALTETASEADLAAMQEVEQRAAERRRRQSHSATNSVSNAALVVDAYGKKVWGELDLQAIHLGAVVGVVRTSDRTLYTCHILHRR